jgi:RNA polymerase sigma-70 factor (ECF subfamily)
VQDFPFSGNYPGNMTDMKPAPQSDDSARSLAEPGIDWAGELARHDRWLRTVIAARLGEGQAVNEVMQEVALAAVAQRAPLADCTRVGAWLYRLAVRQVLLYRRRTGRQRKLINGYANNHHGAPAVREPLDWLLLDERCSLVRRALERLPERDAEILLLKYTENWSYRVLATHLGVSQSAVEARLHRARARLRTTLNDMNEMEVSE